MVIVAHRAIADFSASPAGDGNQRRNTKWSFHPAADPDVLCAVVVLGEPPGVQGEGRPGQRPKVTREKKSNKKRQAVMNRELGTF